MHRPLVNVTWLAHPPADYSELSRTQTSQLVTKVLHSDFPRTVLREFTRLPPIRRDRLDARDHSRGNVQPNGCR